MVRKIFQKLENGYEQEYGKQYESIEMLTNLVRLQLVGATKQVEKMYRHTAQRSNKNEKMATYQSSRKLYQIEMLSKTVRFQLIGS